MSVAFLLTTLLVVVTPGTGVVYTLAAGLSHGRRAGVVAAFACTVGTVPHLVATVTGLAALLHTSTVAYETVKYLGVVYLLHMAWSTLRAGDSLVADREAPPRPVGRVIVSGLWLNLLNPKVTMFFVAFLPQFVPGGGQGSARDLLALGAVFTGMTFVVFAAYGLCAAAVRERLLARPRVMTGLNRVVAACFVGLGLRLAVA
ncbi:LysE family translocator [Streptomyces genisteinicus]|uniref:LysE family translocator n=1 Tax=Streptomyces genisteinicus TaxID=2768068 RepID=A0A7H0HNK2_9ACTN|nr:LysE family translocator [Streptomyces genisteinicus]QNP62118.1 LysE family translocator [Streptomyces genisteinicus]